MRGLWQGAPGTAMGMLALAACCASPAAGVRLHGREPEGREFIFYPDGEEPDASELLENAKMPKKVAPPATRVIYAPSWRCGFDDSFTRVLGLMQIALAANARLVLHPPKDVLERKHSNLTHAAEWWDDYLEADPAFYRDKDIEACEPVTLDFDGFLKEISLGGGSTFFDHSDKLCVQLTPDWRNISGSPEVEKAVEESGGKVRLYTSSKIARYVKKVYKEIGKNYSAAHVRQGDKGTPPCTSPAFVAEKMIDAGGREDRWFVASNGNSSWYSGLRSQAAKSGLDIVSEKQLHSLDSLKDNYFRYAVEKCLFGGAERFLDTYHSVAFGCKPVKPGRTRWLAMLCQE